MINCLKRILLKAIKLGLTPYFKTQKERFKNTFVKDWIQDCKIALALHWFKSGVGSTVIPSIMCNLSCFLL